MAIKVTQHNTGRIDVLGPQIGDAFTVANGAVSAALTTSGFYRIHATSACIVRFGADLASSTGGEDWPEGHVEVRYIPAGAKIAVGAA